VAAGGASCRCCTSFRSARVHGIGGVAAAAILVLCAAGPHLSLLHSATGAHQLRTSWGAPDQGAGVRRPIGPVGVRWSPGDQTNSLPLNLTLYFSFPFTFSHFIMDLCIEHASSSRSSADRYNTRFRSETDSLTFWALVVRRSQAIP
jgi:hypothetical protein